MLLSETGVKTSDMNNEQGRSRPLSIPSVAEVCTLNSGDPVFARSPIVPYILSLCIGHFFVFILPGNPVPNFSCCWECSTLATR